jgi:hypothetical protein
MSKFVGFELNPDYAKMASEMTAERMYARKPASYTYEFTAPAIDLSMLKEAVGRALKIPCLEITSAYRNDSLVTLTFQFPKRLSTQERGVLHHILLSQDHPTVPHPNDEWI